MKEPASDPQITGKRPMGFWKTWSMTVGIMIGSGVFLLPAVLAPYGGIGFLGWLATSSGAILLALIMARLVPHTKRAGGPYAFAYENFGPLVGFVVGWGYWLSIVFGATAIAVAFVGYLTVFVPVLSGSAIAQGATAAGVIMLLALINARGVGLGAMVQLVTTILKLAPLLFVIFLGFSQGDSANLPPFNPAEMPLMEGLAATALLTMWAFIGVEAAAIPSDDVVNPKRTIPMALVTGTLSVTFIYIASTAAIMMLLPMDQLAQSTSPFADAAKLAGPFGAPMIALGALVATLGALNGMIMLLGQMPAAMAQDRLVPGIFGVRNGQGAPANAILFSAVISACLVGLNYREGLIAAFEFLITMSTLGVLVPYAASALAQIKRCWRQSKPWLLLSVVAVVYCIIAMAGSGLETLGWGLAMMVAGLPVYLFSRRSKK